jgi:hypothetical protein
MKRFALLLAVAACTLTATSQETIDILSLTGRYGLPGDYKDAAYGGQATEWGSINTFQAGFNLARNTMFIINLNHFYFNLQGEPEPAFPAEVANPVIVNGIILRTGIRQYFSDGRQLQVLVMPRLMSDFRNLDGNSFMLGAAAIYKKTYRDELSVGFGAVYNTELFGPYLVPVLDLYWQFAEKWRIWGMIPITARVEYDVSEDMMVGFNHFGLITTYALGDEAYQGDYLERQSIDLSLFVRHRLFGGLHVEAMAGRALGRKYRQFEGDQKVDFGIPLITFGDERVLKNEYAAFDDGFIFTLKLIYNMAIPERD